MNEDEFWTLVEEAGQRAEGRGFWPSLAEHVHRLSVVDALDLHLLWVQRSVRAHRHDVWLAFDLAVNGVDEELFLVARDWLIARGRTTFERVLADPDSLADLSVELDATPEPGDRIAGLVRGLATEFDGLSGEVETILARHPGIPLFEEPTGTALPRDLAVLERTFPRLVAGLRASGESLRPRPGSAGSRSVKESVARIEDAFGSLLPGTTP